MTKSNTYFRIASFLLLVTYLLLLDGVDAGYPKIVLMTPALVAVGCFLLSKYYQTGKRSQQELAEQRWMEKERYLLEKEAILERARQRKAPSSASGQVGLE